MPSPDCPHPTTTYTSKGEQCNSCGEYMDSLAQESDVLYDEENTGYES